MSMVGDRHRDKGEALSRPQTAIISDNDNNNQQTNNETKDKDTMKK
jgi:hypothetical protein